MLAPPQVQTVGAEPQVQTLAAGGRWRAARFLVRSSF